MTPRRPGARRTLLIGAMLLAAATAAGVTACGAGAPPADKPAADKPAVATPGSQTRTITVDKRRRTYRLFLPQPPDGALVPLVLAFHGGQGDGQTMARQTRFEQLAAREGFAVAFPDSLEYWQDGRATTGRGEYDVRFVREIVARLAADERIDPRRVYATGLSNGGMFTLRLACEAGDLIAAFAPVIASFPDAYVDACDPVRPVPVLMINGTDDRLIQWAGGNILKGRKRGAGGVVIPVEKTVEFWRNNNACAATPVSEALPDRDPGDGTTVSLIRYAQCASGADVTLVRIDGGGHTWPAFDATSAGPAKRLVGNVSRDYDASAEIWRFFSRHSLPSS